MMEATNPQPTVMSADLGALQRPSYFRCPGWFGWLFAAMLATGAGYAFSRYGAYVDGYECGILIATVPAFVRLGWIWKPVRVLMVGIVVLSLFDISQYAGADGPDLARAKHAFFFRYFLASQSAILWMSALISLSILLFWTGLLLRRKADGFIGSKLCWAAVVLDLISMLMRQYGSYLVSADIGHIPVSNLYEVFILFTLITPLFYPYYEQRCETRALGPFAMLMASATVGFLLWYTVSRGTQGIQPLVLVLQSWWTKIHVLANFISCGMFALSAMVGVAYLLKERGVLADRLPSLGVLDDTMHRAIVAGFAFFTTTTILGALRAADTWGGYWS